MRMANRQRVVIYGAGMFARALWDRLADTYEIVGVADGAESKAGHAFIGHRIVSPEGIADLDPEKILLACLPRHESSVRARLATLGLEQLVVASAELPEAELVTRQIQEAARMRVDTRNLLLQRDLISGRKRAVGWGAGGLAPLYLATAPYDFECIVDRAATDEQPREIRGVTVRPLSWLGSVNADSHGLVMMTNQVSLDDYEKTMNEFGFFQTTTPLLPARDLPSLAPDETEANRLRSEWRDSLRSLLTGVKPRQLTRVQRVMLWIYGLDSGGAERQMVVLAGALRELGLDVELVTAQPDPEHCREWAGQLAAAGVKRHVLSSPRGAIDCLAMGSPAEAGLLSTLGKHFEPIAAVRMMQGLARMALWQPDLVVCYLDQSNVIGGVSAVLAGVPRVLMAARNVNPEHFPLWNHSLPTEMDRLPEVYLGLMAQENVFLVANSREGSSSYESWLGLEDSAIPVVPNAVVSPESLVSRAESRRELGLHPDAHVIVGVMRLATEKDPLCWLQVIARLRDPSRNVVAVIVGDGELRSEVEGAIASLGLTEHVVLAGRRSNVGTYLRAADLLLLTSMVEGMPNVILEAQAHGTPVVATDVGAVREATAPELQQFLCPVGHVDGLVDACRRILENPTEATNAAEQARRRILDKYSPRALAKNTLAAAGLKFGALDEGWSS